MTVDEFYELARLARIACPHWRYGQALFNILLDVRPDLAEQVRGTDKDPFYALGNTNDPRLIAFGEFVNAHWNDPIT
jgi:hypothetical protein